jgi:GalNAc-alpha-(1->4)-GalNAc-alpha-(1->3)-diNAcBac-PP-undecaprenol alpha-1,4-N-acetyl-D-galactosaminyltransferase
MHITLITSSLRAGGAERMLSQMGNYWAAKGWEVTLLTLNGLSERPFYELHPALTHRPLGIAAASGSPLQAVANNAWRLRVLRSAIEASRPQIVLSFMDRANTLTLLATVGTNWPILVSERNDPGQRVLNRSWAMLRQLSYSRASRLVVQTEGALAYFSPRLQQRARVIPNPVLLPPGSDSPLLSSQRAKTLLAMGRLHPQKGFDLLLQAFARVAPRQPNWSLTIYGEGQLRAQLEAQVQQWGLQGRVRLPGVTNQPGAAMRQADMFVLSSRYEGFPNVLGEAMACGLPVISFDCPSGPRELIRDGIDGALVPPGDVAALARTIERLMDSEGGRRRLAARAPEVLERFAMTKVMQIWERLIAELV